MDCECRSKIVANLDFIASNVSSISQLLNLLLQNSVLSSVEIETIKSYQPRYKAVTELANLICKKDTEKFPVFIKCLTESGNESVAKKIMTHRTVVEDTSQQMWIGMTSTTTYYVGRETEMELLVKYWNNCLTRKTFSIAAITGLGGVGKSELAKNFAKWVYETAGGHCVWIEAETPQSLVESFQNLAKKNLKISLNDDFGREKEFLEIAGEAYEKLFGQKVLLVLDNVENYDLPVLKLLNDLSHSQPPTVLKPFVITTSRLCDAKKYFGTHCNQIDLQILANHSAMEFFYKSFSINETSGDDAINQLISKLCQRLQNYPLALQQASAFIIERTAFYGTNLNEEIESYLDQIETVSKRLLNYQLPQYDALENLSKTTFFTWRVTFDRLREESDGVAVDIMNIISFLSPDNIPSYIVKEILQTTKTTLNRANVDYVFDLIRKYSMINYSSDKLISVHRLVQEATRIELGKREFRSILNNITRCMMKMLKGNISSTDLVHFQIVWQHLSRDKEMMVKHGRILDRICRKLNAVGKYREILLFSSESGDLLENLLGPNSRWTMDMKYWKGRVLNNLGEYSDALKVLNGVYEKQKNIFGEDDKDCLSTAHELGGLYRRLKNNEDALKFLETVLEKRERIYGNEHKNTLTTKNNIAVVLHEQNRFDEAMKIYEEVLEVQERLLGVEHHSTLTTKHNIAMVKFDQEDYGKALKEFKKVLEIEERFLELNHPTTLKTKYHIALTYYELGRYEESLQLAKQVHENRLKILGPRHPQTIDTEKLLKVLETEIAKTGQ